MQKGLQRLVKKSLISAINKNEFQLTKIGETKAKRLVRIHRLWEVYLSKHLNIAADHVHNDAEAMEHLITPELEKELEQFLNYPTADPHNKIIPYE